MIGRWPALAGSLAVGAALGTAAADAPLDHFIDPHIEVDGQPFGKAAKTFRYEDRGDRSAARGEARDSR